MENSDEKIICQVNCDCIEQAEREAGGSVQNYACLYGHTGESLDAVKSESQANDLEQFMNEVPATEAEEQSDPERFTLELESLGFKHSHADEEGYVTYERQLWRSVYIVTVPGPFAWEELPENSKATFKVERYSYILSDEPSIQQEKVFALKMDRYGYSIVAGVLAQLPTF